MLNHVWSVARFGPRWATTGAGRGPLRRLDHEAFRFAVNGGPTGATPAAPPTGEPGNPTGRTPERASDQVPECPLEQATDRPVDLTGNSDPADDEGAETRAGGESPATGDSPAAGESPAGGERQVDPDRLADLVHRSQRGDALAIDELLRILEPYVGRLCAPIAMQDAADAAQESLIVIFRSIGQLKEPAALFGWVRTICTREAVRVARRRKTTVSAELSHLPARGDQQLATDIQDTLRRLSPEHRAMLVLRDLEGLDEKTVARLLDLPLGTVRSRLFRARQMFRSIWG